MTSIKPQTFNNGNLVTIAGRSFTINFNDKTEVILLRGERGALFFMKPLNGDEQGLYCIVSKKSGASLSDRTFHNAMVFVVGDILTDFTAT